ncbi:hypothetical protein AB8P52_04120 [Companilactobacillus pabuli]|uniref:hypothetical protein n=1 Tax=Companilactobacillus pabuli TaxID=2714036 RepID=UPI0035128EAE
MNNLSNEITKLSKLLQKQIPKGYQELVTEYVRQNIAGAIYDLLAMVICVLAVYLIVKTVTHAVNNKKESIFFEHGNWSDPDLSLTGIASTVLAIVTMVTVLIVFIAALLDIQQAIQYAVAPNYYLIKSFIK